jgi:hypothetical protein
VTVTSLDSPRSARFSIVCKYMPKPTWFEWITVAAIVLGPILALLSQRLLDRVREKKDRRVRLFFTLMSTRATPLAPDHINALNSIDVVFETNATIKGTGFVCCAFLIAKR